MATAEVNVSELTFEMTKKLKFYLSKLVEHKGSDLHVKTGTTIRGRINGEIVSFSKEALSHGDGLTLAKELLRSRFGELVERKISTLPSSSTMITAFVSICFSKSMVFQRFLERFRWYFLP